jgi:hypothetical protein
LYHDHVGVNKALGGQKNTNKIKRKVGAYRISGFRNIGPKFSKNK